MAVKAIGAVLAVGVVGGGAAAVATAEGESAEVVRVVDGDTFEARIDGVVQRVRLLNVDTPETKHPDMAVQCLGPEASAFLASTLAPGSTVTLTYDEQRLDRYGRLLAGVETADDVFVNAEIAARGLGVAKVYEPNRRYYDEVRAAQDDARRRGVGLYSPEVACTVPGRVAGVEQVAEVAAPTSPDAMEAEADRWDALAASASSARAWFDRPRLGLVWEAIDADTQDGLRSRVDRSAGTSRDTATSWRGRAAEVRAADREAARAAEQARREADRRAREQAAEQRRAEAAARAEARRVAREAAEAAAAASSASVPDTDSGSDSGSGSGRSSSSSGGGAGYTGPRCYEPGGKVWHPC